MRHAPRWTRVAATWLTVLAVAVVALGPLLCPERAEAGRRWGRTNRKQEEEPPPPPPSAVAPAASADPEARRARAVDAALQRARYLLETGKPAEASRLLAPVRQGLGEERDPRVEGLLARVLLALDRPKVALQVAEPFAEPRDAYDPARSDCYLAAGNAYLATDRPYKALVLFDWMAGQAEGLDLILAAEGCGRALLARKEFLKAADSFRFALKYARKGYDYPEEIKDVLRRLEKQLARAERLADIERYGEEFVRYRDAERLRRIHHKFAEARAVYAEVVKKWPETIYAEASRLYAAKCLVALGKTDEAKRELHVFRQADPYGLYRGEAAVEMGRIALEHDLQPKAARGAFLLAETWMDEVTNREPLNIERLAVPEKARRVTAPPQREKSVDFWGNVRKNEIEPGQLVNRHTCPWYLDDLKEQCAMVLGFLAFVDGRNDEALAHYRRILECDPATRRMDTQGVWNDYSRLKWGAEHGYLYAYPGELAAFKDSRRRLGVLLADFYYVTQRWDEARHMAHRLLKGEAGPLSPAAREYAQYACAAAVYRTDGRDKAVPEYLKVVRAGGGRLYTFTQQRAAYAAANLARGSSKKEIRDLARDLLVRLVKSPEQSSETYKARIVLAQDLIKEDQKAEGLALLHSMPASAGDYKILADYYVKRYTSPNESE